jgi:hypothetical protein
MLFVVFPLSLIFVAFSIFFDAIILHF